MGKAKNREVKEEKGEVIVFKRAAFQRDLTLLMLVCFVIGGLVFFLVSDALACWGKVQNNIGLSFEELDGVSGGAMCDANLVISPPSKTR